MEARPSEMSGDAEPPEAEPAQEARSARSTRCPAPEPQERKPNVETIAAEGLRWVNIERPTPLECAWLEEHFGFHALDLEDVLSRNQRPKIDEYPDYLFIVLHFPVFDRAVGRLTRASWTSSSAPTTWSRSRTSRCSRSTTCSSAAASKEELREQHFSKGPGFLLYRVVDDGFDYCFPMLRKIGNKLDASRTRSSRATPRRSCATSPTSSRRSSTSAR